MIWILGIAFVAGIGYRMTQRTLHATLGMPVGIVTGTPEAQELRRQADSIMLVRDEMAKAPVNLNTATAVELQRLNGIGKVLSQRIVDYRNENGPFKSIEDLDKVSGIGPKKLEAVRDHCVITDE
jgi:competence protein ComEA